MNADPRLAPLAELLRLRLITVDEHDDALAELEIVEIQRAHNAAEGIDVPELALDADPLQALAWLLGEELADPQRFLAMLQKLPSQDGRRRLAAAALQQANRQACDTLYDENLISQFQHDAALERLPPDRLIASPVAAMRELLALGVLSQQDYQTLATRARIHGCSIPARMILDGVDRAARQSRASRLRPSTWMIVVIVLVFLALAAPGWFSKPAPVAMPPPVETVERGDLQQRARAMVDSARQPGADDAQYEVQVVQEKVKDEPPR